MYLEAFAVIGNLLVIVNERSCIIFSQFCTFPLLLYAILADMMLSGDVDTPLRFVDIFFSIIEAGVLVERR